MMEIGMMYFDEARLASVPTIVSFLPLGIPIGTSETAREMRSGIFGGSVADRVALSRRLYDELSKCVRTSGMGPPFSVYYGAPDFSYEYLLVILSGFQSPGAAYWFDHYEHRLHLREIWYPNARVFSPISPGDFSMLAIPNEDFEGWRAASIGVLKARGAAPGDFFFPHSELAVFAPK